MNEMTKRNLDSFTEFSLLTSSCICTRDFYELKLRANSIAFQLFFYLVCLLEGLGIPGGIENEWYTPAFGSIKADI